MAEISGSAGFQRVSKNVYRVSGVMRRSARSGLFVATSPSDDARGKLSAASSKPAPPPERSGGSK